MSNDCYWEIDDNISTVDDALIVSMRPGGGGGQPEISGVQRIDKSTVVKPTDLHDKSVLFELVDDPLEPFIKEPICIPVCYPVKFVGGKTRLSVQESGSTNGKRPNIGDLFATLLLLPKTCMPGKPKPVVGDILINESYWVDSIYGRVAPDGAVARLHPSQILLKASFDDPNGRTEHTISLDFRQRIIELRRLCTLLTDKCSGKLAAAFVYYRDILDGKEDFDYRFAGSLRTIIMEQLSKDPQLGYTDGYDPLPSLRLLTASGGKSAPLNTKAPAQFVPHPRNLIFFGAPGTGKSYQLNKCAAENFPKDNIRRVTFYPEYTYSQFVGCYKPVSKAKTTQEDNAEERDTEHEITYDFVPGPFLETYVEAWKNLDQNYLLIVEEINRANPAAVFGDLFQLLDRDESGASEYFVVAASDLRYWLDEQNLAEIYDCHEILQLPPNLYIWATMNSADQGVFPMDTAFKRRWDFRYMGIDAGESELDGLTVKLGAEKRPARWNDVRKGINEVLLRNGVNEDKLLGPFFIKPSDVEDPDRFASAFKDKVLLYLFEDAGKTKRKNIFKHYPMTYSQICEHFDKKGVGIFEGFPELRYLEPESIADGEEGQADGLDAAE